MSTQKNSIDTNKLLLRPKPFTRVMLEDVEDWKEEGLLPRSALDKPLKIEFDPWTNSNPSPQFPESVELFWNGSPLPLKEWTAPIAADDHFIEVPVDWLYEGEHARLLFPGW